MSTSTFNTLQNIVRSAQSAGYSYRRLSCITSIDATALSLLSRGVRRYGGQRSETRLKPVLSKLLHAVEESQDYTLSAICSECTTKSVR